MENSSAQRITDVIGQAKAPQDAASMNMAPDPDALALDLQLGEHVS